MVKEIREDIAFLERRFTTEGGSPYDGIEWEIRTAIIGDPDDQIFEQRGVEVPSFWSQNATNIVAEKYFAYNLDDPRRENSVRQLIDRVAGKIAGEGLKNEYFSKEAYEIFHDELRYILVHQYAAFNSPVWFNQGVEGVDQVASACFILGIDDNLNSIGKWYQEEMDIFRSGSGAGINLSNLRGSKEPLSRGGYSSGPVSFMRGADASAGTIQSGGRCLAPDQYVYTESGPVKVKHLTEAEFICISFDPPAKRYKAKRAQAWESGEKELVKIVTDKGEFLLSEDHPIKLSTGEFVKVSDIKEGVSLFAGSVHLDDEQSIEDRFGSYENFVKEVAMNNHRVVSIEKIGMSKVYDVEVFCPTEDNKTPESGHNFLIWPDENSVGSGIVVSNTRRAAKMVILNDDHPDIEDFITCKSREEDRVRALQAAGFDMGMGTPVGDRNLAEATAYQNANNSVRVTDDFMNALINEEDWELKSRTDDSTTKILPARELMNLMADSAHRCADPGIQYDTTINDWHTTPEQGRINSSNPCCFTGEMLVTTTEGKISFEELVAKANVLPEIVGYDLNTDDCITQKLNKVWKSGEASKLVSVITVSGNILRCTPEHYFYTEEGYVQAQSLTRGVELYTEKGRDSVHEVITIQLDTPIAVYDLESESTSNFMISSSEASPAVAVHNSEYMSNDNTACNLASLNLLKFLGEENSFDTDKFKHAVNIMFLAQEITISYAYFPTKAIGRNTRNMRQIGLGYANLGALLMALAHPYDSDPGREIAASITALMTGQAYLSSALIAERMGPFEFYEKNKEHTLGVIKKHKQESSSLTDEAGLNIGKQAKKVWKETLNQAEEHGVRNSQATVLAPTGCLLPDTYVMSSNGLAKLSELGNLIGDDWQDVNFQVQTDQGPQDATKFFKNGLATVAKITTKAGYELSGTPEHQIKVISGTKWVWRRLSDIQAGDRLPLKLGGMIGTVADVPLPNGTKQTSMNRKLAWLIGYYSCYGSLDKDKLMFAGPEVELAESIVEQLFETDNVASWWSEAGFNNETIPELVRQTNNADIYAEYISGTMFKVSEKMSKELSAMALSIGLVTKYENETLKVIDEGNVFYNGVEMTRNEVEDAWAENEDAGLSHAMTFYYDEIDKVELAEEEMTYDISVPSNLTYVANGFVSHNTISFLMDCDTTGVEPDFSLIKHKILSGGGTMDIINKTVPEALRRMGYSQEELEEIINYIEEDITRGDGSEGSRGHAYGAPHVTEDHARVFDCAVGENAIHHMGHLKMMGAVQPFLSGAISKTVNVPTEMTVEDIVELYIEGWKMGLKSVAIYRDGSKANQPLNESKRDKDAIHASEIGSTSLLGDGLLRGERRNVPRETELEGVNFSIGNIGGYITVRLFEDGTPGAVFVDVGQAGSTLNGFIRVWAVTMSLGLQHGLPLDILASKLAWTQFEPHGFTDDPEIKSARSIVDYVIRWMSSKFLDLDELSRAELGLPPIEKVAKEEITETNEFPGGDIEPKRQLKAATKPAKDRVKVMPTSNICGRCGSADMIRTGSCMTCHSCGDTSGCG